MAGFRFPARRRRRRRRSSKLDRLAARFAVFVFALLAAFAAGQGWLPMPAPESGSGSQLVAQAPARHFPICGSDPRFNCVVDGDTFWFEGERVRIADIDAPEVTRPECPYEAELADRSTIRLQALLNEGPFELRSGSRDRDVYGRLLRTVHRDGRSLGDYLVQEGLARPWRGRSENWC